MLQASMPSIQAQSDRCKVFHQLGQKRKWEMEKKWSMKKPRNYAYTAQFYWDNANVIDAAYVCYAPTA